MQLKCTLFTLLFWAGVAAGSQDLTITDRACVCKEGVQDRFEEPVRFGFGPYAGSCVDSCKFRRARSLPVAEAKKLGADGEHLLFANILHHGQYWTARVPLQQIAEVDVFFERFLAEISHVVLRFRFKSTDPVILFRQDELTSALPTTDKIYDLVLSAEAVPPRGHAFNFFESSFGNYLLDYRVLSLADTFKWMVTDLHHSVLQYRLNFSPESARQLLQVAIRDSESKSFQTPYRLLTNNCATSLMSMLGQSVDFKPGLLDWLELLNVQGAIPIGTRLGTMHALSAMRLLDQQRKNFEDEYPSAHHAAGLTKAADRR